MTDKTIERLASLDSSQDYTDPDVWRNLLNEEPTQAATEAPQGDTTTAAPAPAPAAAEAAPSPAPAPAPVESSATPAAAETQDDKPVGVATKDGKHVIPFEVLDQTRKTAAANAEARARVEAENAQLREQLEAAKQGKATDSTPAAQPFTAERIAQVKEDFPELAEVMELNNKLAAELAETKAAAKSTPARQNDDDTAVFTQMQAAIDERPLLAKWQAKGGIAWQRTAELDEQLRTQPQWANRPFSERFAEVERLVADELGIEVPAPKPAPAPAPSAATPAAPAPQPAAPAPQVVASPPPSISDFNGSAPSTAKDPLADMAVGQAVDKAMSMDLDAIYRLAGIQH